MNIFAFGVCLALTLSACATPRAFLPKRSLHVTFYTDDTCEYSFEGMGSDSREYQKTRQNTLPDGTAPLLVTCRNQRVARGGEFIKKSPEIWPNVAIGFRKIIVGEPLVKTEKGHVYFQPEPPRNYARAKRSVAKRNGSGLSATVLLGPGTKENEERLSLKSQEIYSCGTVFLSDNSDSNWGYIYSEEHQTATGVYMEIKTTVVAKGDTAAGPCW